MLGNFATIERGFSYPIQPLTPHPLPGDERGQIVWDMTGTIQAGVWVANNLVIVTANENSAVTGSVEASGLDNDSDEVLLSAIINSLKSMDMILSDIVSMEACQILKVNTITTKGYQESRFRELVAQWQNEVMNTSSITKMVTNNATYQLIIGMGPDAVPLILRQMESEGDDPDHWGWALSRITGEDPVPKNAAGDTVKIAKAWLSWGRSRHVW